MCKNFLPADGYNVDECLESSSIESTTRFWESHVMDIYLGGCGLVQMLIHWSLQHKLFFFTCQIFAVGLDRPQNYLTAKLSQATVVAVFDQYMALDFQSQIDSNKLKSLASIVHRPSHQILLIAVHL